MRVCPVVEFMFWSFCYAAFDQIFNNAANARYMSGGLINAQLFFVVPQTAELNCRRHPLPHAGKLCGQYPGIKVICLATPADAKGMLKSAIRDNDPVCVMENTILTTQGRSS